MDVLEKIDADTTKKMMMIMIKKIKERLKKEEEEKINIHILLLIENHEDSMSTITTLIETYVPQIDRDIDTTSSCTVFVLEEFQHLFLAISIYCYYV